MAFDHSSKDRLTTYDLLRFPGDSLFDRIARAVCHAGCLPRKELFEAWEVARRSRRLFRGGRVVDLAGGHGLLAHMMLLLDASSPYAIVVDSKIPPSAQKIHEQLTAEWPALSGRVQFKAADLHDETLAPTDVVVSAHACGALTDTILDLAVAARARVAVLPCCHDLLACDSGDLRGWVDAPLAIDVLRAMHVKSAGYRVWTRTIPAEITPKNRLLLAAPQPAI